MRSTTTPRFWKTYRDLPKEIKQQAKQTYTMWKRKPYHSSLHFKEVSKDVYSVRIGRGWRALGLRENTDKIAWFWIGSHEEYNNLIKQL